MSVLLQAACPHGHTWDVWGEEQEDRPPLVKRDALVCPECEPHGSGWATSIEAPESLA